MTTPISPDEIGKQQIKSIPPEVFEVFNRLIALDWSGISATVTQEEAVAAIIEKMEVSRNKVFDSGWLNIEEAYRDVGWKVVYDKPGYNESYGANWKFTRK